MPDIKCATLTVGGAPACTEGEYRCNGTQRQQCIGGVWTNVADPNNICGGGGVQYNLEVMSIVLTPTSITLGQTCFIGGVIQNTGTAASPAAGPFLTLTVNGVEVARTASRLPSLAPGQAAHIDPQYAYKPTVSGSLNVCWKLVW